MGSSTSKKVDAADIENLKRHREESKRFDRYREESERFDEEQWRYMQDKADEKTAEIRERIRKREHPTPLDEFYVRNPDAKYVLLHLKGSIMSLTELSDLLGQFSELRVRLIDYDKGYFGLLYLDDEPRVTGLLPLPNNWTPSLKIRVDIHTSHNHYETYLLAVVGRRVGDVSPECPQSTRYFFTPYGTD